MMSGAQAYYKAALSGLKYVEARSPSNRRFGAEADAIWKGFAGDLSAADRIDLLIRDADAQWPGALGPRGVFAFGGVAEDEPFGPDWEPLDAVDAEKLWRASALEPAPADITAALAQIAGAWDIELSDHAVPEIGAADRFVVAGPSAVAALMQAFVDRQDLDWSEQVVCVATPPGHRQIAVAGGALLNLAKRTVVATATDEAVTTAPGSKLVVSGDAAPEDGARARELQGG